MYHTFYYLFVTKDLNALTKVVPGPGVPILETIFFFDIFLLAVNVGIGSDLYKELVVVVVNNC